MEFVLSSGLWHVEEQLLLLSSWTENHGEEGLNFAKMDFWVQIIGLPDEWYSSRISRKLFSYLTDCSVVELGTFWGSKIKFFCIRVSVQVEKPLRRFLHAGSLVDDEHSGLFKYEHLYSLCYRCGCLGHLRRDCCRPQLDSISEKLWYGLWMQAETAARASIVWTMSREAFLQEEEELFMLNRILDHGPRAPDNVVEPSKKREEVVAATVAVSNNTTCLVLGVETHAGLIPHREWGL